MRKFVSLAGVVAFGLLSFSAGAVTPAKKKSAPKKGVAVAHKKTGSATSGATRTAAGKRGKKGTGRQPATSWRNRQLSPTPERYKEIQQALATKGYLPADQANGKWSDSSTEALKKFQADQNLSGNGKINSLSLIALGLGPKRDTSSAAKPAPPAASVAP